MRAIVLGTSGLTGRAISLELARAGWEVVGTGRDRARFPVELDRAGVSFVQSDRTDPRELSACLSRGADVVVDCLCYTALQARQLLEHRSSFGSAVVLSSKAVYVDPRGRHSNSEQSPAFGHAVREDQPVLEPDFSGEYDTMAGYGRNKVAVEQVLLDSGIDVSILRPSRIHGLGTARPRAWFVVRRLLDGRERIPLAHDGRTGNHPTAAVNLARLVRTCAEAPGRRVLNAGDPDTPTARDVVEAVARACDIPIEVVGLPDEAPAGLGWSPWATWPPFLLDTSAAVELGYEPVGTYVETVGPYARSLLRVTPDERARLDADPYFAGRLDYRTDDAALAWA